MIGKRVVVFIKQIEAIPCMNFNVEYGVVIQEHEEDSWEILLDNGDLVRVVKEYVEIFDDWGFEE